MKILSIDTSTKNLSMAVSSGQKIIKTNNIVLHRMLSSSIIPSINKVLKSSKISLKDIDGFAVGLGPGSFTSLRVGLSTVKALAFATNKPVVGVSSLDTIAMSVKDLDCENVCVVCDAKRNLVYSCLYQKKGNELKRKSDYMLISIDELLKVVQKKTIFVGDGIEIFRDNIAKHCSKTGSKILKDETSWCPEARNLLFLALPKFSKKKYSNINKLTPLYLYPKDCQVRK